MSPAATACAGTRPAPPRWRGTLLLLGVAHAVCRFATWLSFVAVLMRVHDVFRLSLGLAILIVCRRLPVMTFSWAGGSLADRCHPKSVVAGTNAAMLAVVLLLWRLDYSRPGFYPPLILSFLLLSALEGVYKPAFQALLSNLVPDTKSLEQANTALNGVGMLTVLLAGALSPLLANGRLLNDLLLLDAAVYLASLMLFLFIPTQRLACKGLKALPCGSWAPAPAGMAALGLTCVLSVVYSFMTLAVIQFPREVYRSAHAGTAAMSAAMGLGILLSLLLYRVRPAPRQPTSAALLDRALVPAGLLCCAFLLFVRSSAFPWAVAGLVATTAGLGYLKILAENVFFLSSASGSVGRSFSVLYMADELSVACASIALSVLADRISLVSVGVHLGWAAIAALLCAFLAVRRDATWFWVILQGRGETGLWGLQWRRQ